MKISWEAWCRMARTSASGVDFPLEGSSTLIYYCSIRPAWAGLLWWVTMERSQLHTPCILSPCLLLKTLWRRRSEGQVLWLSHPMGFEEETRREDAMTTQLRSSLSLYTDSHWSRMK
jgi:hypothetical protein